MASWLSLHRSSKTAEFHTTEKQHDTSPAPLRHQRSKSMPGPMASEHTIQPPAPSRWKSFQALFHKSAPHEVPTTPWLMLPPHDLETTILDTMGNLHASLVSATYQVWEKTQKKIFETLQTAHFNLSANNQAKENLLEALNNFAEHAEKQDELPAYAQKNFYQYLCIVINSFGSNAPATFQCHELNELMFALNAVLMLERAINSSKIQDLIQIDIEIQYATAQSESNTDRARIFQERTGLPWDGRLGAYDAYTKSHHKDLQSLSQDEHQRIKGLLESHEQPMSEHDAFSVKKILAYTAMYHMHRIHRVLFPQRINNSSDRFLKLYHQTWVTFKDFYLKIDPTYQST